MINIALAALLVGACHRHEAPRGRTSVSAMLDPQRDKLLKPDLLVARLGLAPGMTVADVGAGPGYLTLRLARAVAPGGRVIATDVDDDALAVLRRRIAEAKLINIEVRKVAPDDPGLDPASVDLALLVHVATFLPDETAWFARLRPSLRPRARVAVVGYASDRDAVLAAATRAGYHLVDDAGALLPAQFFVFLAP